MGGTGGSCVGWARWQEAADNTEPIINAKTISIRIQSHLQEEQHQGERREHLSRGIHPIGNQSSDR
ncbi:hypothetical protein C5Y93_29560 [Blastopirellula marina]|uniref:Uncharacterized protein n=1 Tax=Blastopirellula marina TaxID=124 RepID=A0A2S8GDD8_9BACT|nr:hypothetical protein C5Y93_29560 [Blastopirellula marina]